MVNKAFARIQYPLGNDFELLVSQISFATLFPKLIIKSDPTYYTITDSVISQGSIKGEQGNILVFTSYFLGLMSLLAIPVSRSEVRWM